MESHTFVTFKIKLLSNFKKKAMREIKKIKLNEFSKNELNRRKLNTLKGGCNCIYDNCVCMGYFFYWFDSVDADIDMRMASAY